MPATETSVDSVNSPAYWNSRFQRDWDQHGVPDQTRFFARLACERLPQWLRDDIAARSLAIFDYGCAEGDAVPIITEAFPASIVGGGDVAAVGVEIAQGRFPQHNFTVLPTDKPDLQTDVIFCSNVIEHFADWQEKLDWMADCAREHVLVMAPFQEEAPLIAEHLASFDFGTLPVQIANGHRLAHHVAFESTHLPGARWVGSQFIAVWSRNPPSVMRGPHLSVGTADDMDLRDVPVDSIAALMALARPTYAQKLAASDAARQAELETSRHVNEAKLDARENEYAGAPQGRESLTSAYKAQRKLSLSAFRWVRRSLRSEQRKRVPILDDVALEAAWESSPEIVETALGQLTPYDAIISYWAAKKFFTGRGTIVEAGALVGSASCRFAEGLLANLCAPNDQIIHSYDLFEDDYDGPMATLIRGWFKDAQSPGETYDFLRHFESQTASYARFIKTHKGDMLTARYDDRRDVEILAIDVAKSPDLTIAVAQTFFTRLMPGHSLVLHQDYIFAFQPWLQISMGLLGDVFERVYDAPNHCTAVFRPTRRITSRFITDRLGTSGSEFYKPENAVYLHHAIDGARSLYGAFVHTAALSYFYFTLGQTRTAKFVANRMLDEFGVTRNMINEAAIGGYLRDHMQIDWETRC